MSAQRILLVIALVAKSIVANAGSEGLGGASFGNPGRVWQSVPSDWLQQPITPELEVQDADLVISLDQQLYPYLLPLIEAYARTHGLTIAAKKGTCGMSAGLLLRKAIDIGGFCCPPSDADRLPGLRFHALAIAAVAFFVHVDNPVEDLTLSQVRQLFRGEITDWTSVGEVPEQWASRIVHPVARLHCPTRPGHWRLLLDSEELFSPDLLDVGAIEDEVRSVAADRQAIGYETLWMVRNHPASGQVKSLRLNGVSPTNRAALAQGRYPVYRVYNVSTWEGAVGKSLASELVGYLLDRVQEMNDPFYMVPASELREQGWKFKGDEVVGEPALNTTQEPP